MRESFQKDYDTLHKFIDMMKDAESMSVEGYHDVIVEKHNESIGFLKSAIFQAQSNVLDEIAKQREVASKTKFTYMKPRGPLPQARAFDHETAPEEDDSRSVSDYASSGEVERCAAADVTPSVEAARVVQTVENGNRFGVSIEQPRRRSFYPLPSGMSINVAAKKMPVQGIHLVKESASGVLLESGGGQKHNGPPRDPRKLECDEKGAPKSIARDPRGLGSAGKMIETTMKEAPKPDQEEKTQRQAKGKPTPPHQILSSLRKAASRSMPKSTEHGPPEQPSGQFTPASPASHQATASIPSDPRFNRSNSNVIQSLKNPSSNHTSTPSEPVNPPGRQSQPVAQQLKRPVERRSGSLSVAPRSKAGGPSTPKKARVPPRLQRTYAIGTVVMAKFQKYSFWPGIVVKRPASSIDRSFANGGTLPRNVTRDFPKLSFRTSSLAY